MGSKSKSTPAAPVPTAADIAQQQVAAQQASIPKAAQLQYDVLTNPQYGLGATTAEYEKVRSEQFPQETQVREQMLSNILGSLLSPTGLTSEQEAAVGQRRGEAQSELQTALRERANLGGGLYGGRAGKTEERAVGDLQARFAEEDIQRQETARLNALQAALPALQLLFPDVNLQAPSFINPVASPESSLQASVAGRGQDIQAQQADQARQSALMTALFSGAGSFGTALGGTLGQRVGSYKRKENDGSLGG